MKKFVLLPLVFVAACETVAPPPVNVVPPAGQDTCGASQHANLVGQDATALEKILIMGPVRVIHPGQAVTMDFRANRINFGIDAAGKIEQIFCA